MATTTLADRPAANGVVPVPLISTHKQGGGALIATVLSAYDLPSSEPPKCVSLKALNLCAKTGPPSSRHKDRNSFRFLANQTLRIEAPLRDLYPGKAILTVEYANPANNWTAPVVLNSLPIQETTWLILNLSKENGGNTTSATSEEEEEEVPSLRLQIRLEGPYRMEIGALVNMFRSWFHVVDGVQDNTKALTSSLPPMPSAKYLLVPTVPLMTGLVVLAPIVTGILVVGLPVFLPVLAVLVSIFVAGTVVVGGLYASTRTGRHQIGSICAPLLHTVLSTESGQVLVYETGPRPTPVSVARWVLPTDLYGKLAVSLLIDLLGSASYLLPVVGESFDLAWAPIQTVLIMAMYNNVAPNLKYVSFMEEILPFTDVVPSATIGWVTEFGPDIIPPSLLGLSEKNKGPVTSDQLRAMQG